MSIVAVPEPVLELDPGTDYCVSEATTGLGDVPALLVAVTETDCRRLTNDVLELELPFDNVNGTETENWPPKLSDCVLLNHTWAFGAMFTVIELLDRLAEDCGVNWKERVERSRVVAYPDTCRVSEVVVAAVTSALVNWTGPEGTERESVGGDAGVTSKPLARANDGVTVIVPATLPVCRLI
jgi:hypothetical protein